MRKRKHPLPATPAVPLGKGDKSKYVCLIKKGSISFSINHPIENFPSFSRRGGSAQRRRGGVGRHVRFYSIFLFIFPWFPILKLRDGNEKKPRKKRDRCPLLVYARDGYPGRSKNGKGTWGWVERWPHLPIYPFTHLRFTPCPMPHAPCLPRSAVYGQRSISLVLILTQIIIRFF